MSSQLTLFDDLAAVPPDDAQRPRRCSAMHQEARATRRRGCPGNSTSAPARGVSRDGGGWSTRRAAAQASLAREGLREYARHPLLTTVGVDRSYYAPIPIADLRDYADPAPRRVPVLLQGPRRGDGAGPGDARTAVCRTPTSCRSIGLVTDLLAPCAGAFRAHTGPIVLEFPPFRAQHRLAPADFHARLDAFLERLPGEFEYAVELRDARLLTPAYRDILRRHRIAHTYNYWSAMPAPADQAAIVPPEDGPFAVVRLLLRPGTLVRGPARPLQAVRSARGAGRGDARGRRLGDPARPVARPARVHPGEQQGGGIVAADRHGPRETAGGGRGEAK